MAKAAWRNWKVLIYCAKELAMMAIILFIVFSGLTHSLSLFPPRTYSFTFWEICLGNLNFCKVISYCFHINKCAVQSIYLYNLYL